MADTVRRTNKKISFKDGTKRIVRTVYEVDCGDGIIEYFKYQGSGHNIYHKQDGKLWTPWLTGLRYEE